MHTGTQPNTKQKGKDHEKPAPRTKVLHWGDAYYRHHLFRKFVYTKGVQYLAENAGAYWLLDFIFSNQSAAIAAQEFQVWTIKLLPAGGASITVGDGNGNRVARFKIPYTDFPLDGFSLWFIGGTLLLPSEY